MDEFEKLVAEEDAFDEALKAEAPAPSPVSQGVPDSLRPQGDFKWPLVAPPEPVAQQPQQPLGSKIWQGLQESQANIGNAALGVVSPALQAVVGKSPLSAVVNPIKQEYIDPVVRSAQDAAREELTEGADPQALEKLFGPGGAQLARNVGSLVYGDPARYRTPQQQLAGNEALAQAGEKLIPGAPLAAVANVAQDVEAFVQGKPSPAPITSEEAAGAFANTFTSELGNLPLYLIDAPATASLGTRALVGGGLSETLDPREGADPVRGALFAGGLGAGFEAVAQGAMRWARRVKVPTVADLATKQSVAVTPNADLPKLMDAPAQPLLPGAKAPLVEARVGAKGLETRPVAVTPEGKAVGEWLPVAERNVPARSIVLAGPEAATEMKALGLEGQLLEVKVAADMPAEALALGRGAAIDEARIRTPEGERVLFDDDAALPLNKLPEDNFLVSWDRGDGNLDFRKVDARDLQVESLKRRSLVEVVLPNGERRVGFAGATEGSKEGSLVVVRPEPDEMIPGALEVDAAIPNQSVKPLSESRIRTLLDERELLVARQRADAMEAAANQQQAEAAMEAAQIAPEVVVQTPTGPKVAVSVLDGQPPPQPAPQNLNAETSTPVMVNGNGAVVPPNTPITPAMTAPPGPTGFNGAKDALLRAGWSVIDLFINPAARGRRPMQRGAIQDQGKLLALATDAAGASQASAVLESLTPRLLDAQAKRVAPWRDALPPAEQRRFNLDVERFFNDEKATVAELLQKWPQLSESVRQNILDTKMHLARGKQMLTSKGFIHTRDFTAPEGLEKLAEDLTLDEGYLARIHLAPLLGKKGLSQIYKKGTQQYADLVNEVADDILKTKEKGLTRADVLSESMEQLEKFLGNPDGLLDTLAKGKSGGGGQQGRQAVKAKRAAKLPVMAKVYGEWTQQNPEVAPLAAAFLRGKLNEKGLNDALTKAGKSLPPKDIAFLQEMKEQIAERLKPWQQKALGTTQDPFTRAAFSVVRQDELLANAAMVNSLAEGGMVRTAAELEAMGIVPVRDGWKEVPNDPARWGKFAGGQGPAKAWVHPDVWDHVNQIPEKLRQLNQMHGDALNGDFGVGIQAAARTHSMFRFAKTVLSPASWVTNVTSNMLGVARAGISPIDFVRNNGFVDVIKQWREFNESPNAISIPGKELTAGDWVRDGMRYGTIGTDMMSSEMQPLLLAMMRDDVFGKATTPLQFSQGFRRLAQLGFAMPEAYAAIDSFFKHGTWLSMLKKGGLDVKTGAVDRAKADAYINGSKFRQMVQTQAMAQDLSRMSDAQVVEALKRTAAFRMRRSFAIQAQPGLATRVTGAVANASLGTMANDFAKTAMEEARANMMLPWRMVTEPGVAGAMLGWGVLVGGVGVAMNAARNATGFDPAEADKSYLALPTSARAYSPNKVGAYRLTDDGRYAFLNLDRIFEPLRYMAGDPMGRTIPEQAQASPGQLAARTAYNILAGTPFGGSLVGEKTIDPAARQLGLELHERWQSPHNSFLGGIARYILPTPVVQFGDAYDRAIQSGQLAAETLKLRSGGLLEAGGKPADAAKRETVEMNYIEAPRDEINYLKSEIKKAYTRGDDAAAQKLTEDLNALKQKRGQTMNLRKENQ